MRREVSSHLHARFKFVEVRALVVSEAFISALLHNPALMDDKEPFTVSDSAEPVCYHD